MVRDPPSRVDYSLKKSPTWYHYFACELQVACVQPSPISFHPRKRDVCETASLIVFQYPAVFQEFVESAFIGCLRRLATVFLALECIF